jgi:ribonuclease P/MRP protein subunit RPP40
LREDLLGADQFGFLPGRSSVCQLLLLVDRLSAAQDIGVPSDVVYFDFAKAFESVVHSKLLHKLRLLGIGPGLLRWIESFICGRSQRVSVDGRLSDPSEILSGVPQGSVLGPLLFIIFLNDLLVDGSLAVQEKFADDLKLSSDILCGADSARLSEAIEYVSDWASDWQLPISRQKCSVLHVGNKNPRFPYLLADFSLPSCESVRDLGVTITADLKWSVHCSSIVAGAFRRLALVNRCFSSGNLDTRLRAFKIFVRPLLEYACQVWSPHLLSDIDHVESVQRRFTKRLPGLRSLSYGARLGRLDLDSLELRRLKADLILVFKIIKGLLSVDLPFFSLSHATNTRGNGLKCEHLPFHLDCRKYFFAVRCTNVWNSLPRELVLVASVERFRSGLNKINLNRFLRRSEHAAIL